MYLCIDTITQAAGITIVADDFSSHFLLDPMKASEGIIPTIDEALKKSSASLSDLKGVFAIKGPGSFTGLRVGLSVANQFAHQLKIPIIGLTTDQWWLARTDETNITYLQSMNKAEVYLSQSGKSLIKDMNKVAPCTWLGQLSESHRDQLSSDFTEIKNLSSIEGAWGKIAAKFTTEMSQTTYELIEPFYGKEPSITKSKKTISIQDGART